MAFEIVKDVLKKYTEEAGVTEVIIPQGVKKIGMSAFKDCKKITSVSIPNGVTSIGRYAFANCTSLASISIPNSVNSIGSDVFIECSSLVSISIPNGVKSIGGNAFRGCKNLNKISLSDSIEVIGNSAFSSCLSIINIRIPKGVKTVDKYAFFNCKGLETIVLPECIQSIAAEAFERCNNLNSIKAPNGLPNIDLTTIKEFFIPRIKMFDLSTIASVILHNSSKEILKKISSLDLETLNGIGREIAKTLKKSADTVICDSAAKFVTSVGSVLDKTVLNNICSAIKSNKCGAKAAKEIEKISAAMSKTNNKKSDALSAEDIIRARVDEKKIASVFKGEYRFEIKELPVLKDKKKRELPQFVFAWLLCVNDLASTEKVAYNKPGICNEAADIVKLLDQKAFQKALLELATNKISGTGNKLYLAYPLCRYADDDTLEALLARAEKFISVTSGKNAPVIKMFRKACIYSEKRAAMMFAEKYGDLEEYAKLRGTDAETIRDTKLSDVGLEADGTKVYDLGNQKVTAVLLPDFSFQFVSENSIITKSLPKKGADEKLYEEASSDLAVIKKNIRKITNSRYDSILESFLNGKAKSADQWESVYSYNYILKQTAMHIVWSQDKSTFTMTSKGLVDSKGNLYSLGTEPVKVAHPMEMDRNDILRWKKYFITHDLTQPFTQIWEPAIDPKSIKNDRYAGCMIPYYRFMKQDKHGIIVEEDRSESLVYIDFKGMEADIDRIDFVRHRINPDDRFEIKSISFSEYTRQVNHLIAYFDKITVWDRTRKDDLTVADCLPGLDEKDITALIEVAREANSQKVLGMLLAFQKG